MIINMTKKHDNYPLELWIAYFQTNPFLFNILQIVEKTCTYLFDMPWLLWILCALSLIYPRGMIVVLLPNHEGLLGYWSKCQTQRNTNLGQFQKQPIMRHPIYGVTLFAAISG